MRSRPVILAADDTAAHLETLREILGTTYDLHCVASGTDALRLAHERRPDLVLLDVEMPGLDGYETCRLFRLDPVLHTAKIILVSAQAPAEVRQRGDEAGADDTLTRPYEATELEARVKLLLRLKRVEELDRMKSDLWVLIAHETRTPLASMFGALELLHEEADEGAGNLRDLCTLAVTSMVRLRDLLEKSRLLCEFRSDSIEMAPRTIAVAPMLSQTAALSRDRQDRGDLEIRIDAPSELRVHADPSYLPMVLGFVLDYAIRMSPAGKPVDLIAAGANGEVVFHVIYRGPGVPAEHLATMFEPLNGAGADHPSPGAGLGLALAREVARRHGGEVSALSLPDLETRITLRLPIAGNSSGRLLVGAAPVL